MPIQLTDPGNFIERNIGNYISFSADFTVGFWIRNGSTTPGLTEFRQYWLWFNQGSGGEYIYIGSDFNANDVIIELFDGTTYTDTAAFTLDTNWHYITYRYSATTHLLELLVDASVKGSFTHNLSTLPAFPTPIELMGDAFTDFNVGPVRSWQRRLNNSQIVAEANSLNVPVDSTNILTSTPLVSDLNDTTGNGRNWNSGSGYQFTGSRKHNEAAIGEWIRCSQFFTYPSTTQVSTIFLEVSINNQIAASFRARFISSGGGPPGFGVPPTVFGYSVKYYNGTTTVSSSEINNVIADPGSGVYFPLTDRTPRASWNAAQNNHVLAMRVRTASYDSDTATYPADNGEIEVKLDNVSVILLTNLPIRLFSASGTAKLRFGSQGDVDNNWILNRNELPTLNSDGTFNGGNPTSLIKFENWTAATFSPDWQPWDSAGGAGNITPFFLINGGPAASPSISYANLSPYIGYDPAASARAGSGVESLLTSAGGTIPAIGVIPDSSDIPPIGVTGFGTIIVRKILSPDVSGLKFAITAAGGLDPTSFSLGNGESQEFDNVTSGSGYSIVETEQPGWTTTYSVSNGSPNNNITVADNETVTVTITNTSGNGFGGIYKIVKDKTDDTLWLDGGATINVKIPDPFIETLFTDDDT